MSNYVVDKLQQQQQDDTGFHSRYRLVETAQINIGRKTNKQMMAKHPVSGNLFEKVIAE